MKHRKTLQLIASTILLSASLGSSLAQGLPEPPVVLYGTIRNAGVFNARVTSGNLTWRITRLTNGISATTFTLNFPLGNILGQFSYVLEIPCESSLPTAPATNLNAMILTSTTNTYRFEPFVNGSPASFVSAIQNTFSAAPSNRGRLVRTDLTINAPCDDSNNNQICDSWEDQYFGDFADANADPDGDGISNLDEFLAGTDPTDSNSAFVFVEYRSEPTGGFRLQWNSAEGRSYSLLSTTQLLATNNFITVRSNLPATPPRNTFIDTNTLPTGPRFYLLKLEL